MISKDFTISNTRFRSGHTDGPFLAVAITDVFSWVWLVRVKQPGRTWASFSLSGMGWERMFNDGEGHVWWKVWFKLEERRESFRPPSLCPSPLSTGVFHGLSCGCRSGKAPGSRGTGEVDAWEVVRPLAHPLRLGCEAFPVLAKATPLWPKQNRGGGEARIPVWGGMSAHTTGCDSAVWGTRQVWSLEDGQILEVTEGSLRGFLSWGRTIIAFLLE